MSKRLMLKGFEVELFTGKATGEHVGVAADVVKDLPEFVTEPDRRNIEYITQPLIRYESLREALLVPRRKLREWLVPKQLTLLPGSTLSLGDSKKFERSDPLNPYHDLIEETYGTKVVTTSIHINLGVQNVSRLFAALRLVRCEASLFLALSASSPFLDGSPTGAHSQRWLQFPRTPLNVPFFLNHSHYISWVEEQLASGAMSNERHLWTSVRPNGPSRPYELNRLELRICDLISDCDLLLAVTALLELRVLSLFDNPQELDPLEASRLDLAQLSILSDMNDEAAARRSLDATLQHWKDGEDIVCRDWITQVMREVRPLALDLGIAHLLSPIDSALEEGNQAMKWMMAYSDSGSVSRVLQDSIDEMEAEEKFNSHPEAILG